MPQRITLRSISLCFLGEYIGERMLTSNLCPCTPHLAHCPRHRVPRGRNNEQSRKDLKLNPGSQPSAEDEEAKKENQLVMENYCAREPGEPIQWLRTKRTKINKPFSRGGVGVEVLEVSGKNYGSISFGQLSGYIAFCTVPIRGAKPPL